MVDAQSDAPRGILTRYAAFVVRARWWLVTMWLITAVVCVLVPPPIGRQVGETGSLIPLDSPALLAEQRAVSEFGYPLSSRTAVVQRDPGGLSPYVQAESVLDALAINQHPQSWPLLGALPLPNTVRLSPGLGEQSTAVLTYLFMNPISSFEDQAASAKNYVAVHLDRPEDHVVGVTGSVPARAEQARLLSEHLHDLELFTLVAIFILVGIAFRSMIIPAVALAAAGVSVVVTTWSMTWFTGLLGVSAPAELRPLLVALLLGVVTDYTVFYAVGMRIEVGRGRTVRQDARRSIAANTGIVVVAGLTVAAGTATLLVARTTFFKTFGPAMSLTIAIGLLVSVTLVPALFAIFGRLVFWPHARARRAAGRSRDIADETAHAGSRRTLRLARLLVRRRYAGVGLAVCTILLIIASLPLTGIRLGAGFSSALPASNGVARAASAASAAYADGITSPTTLLVEGPEVTSHVQALTELQTAIGKEPGVAATIGPAQTVPDAKVGVVLAPSGNAARMLIVLDHSPLDATAIDDLGRLRTRIPQLAEQVGIAGFTFNLAGDTALAEGLVRDTTDDLARIAAAAVLVNLALLILFLRAVVAPVYLLTCSMMALTASLGLTTWVFTTLSNNDGITFYVPFAAAVLLVSLGSDYNIFGVGTAWELGSRMPLSQAILQAIPRTSRAITTAGIALAVSFGTLAVIPLRPLRELAFAMAVGILIDAFIVRSVMVPSLLTLVGRFSAWPGRGLHGGRP